MASEGIRDFQLPDEYPHLKMYTGDDMQAIVATSACF
jgi:hypothetical protein